MHSTFVTKSSVHARMIWVMKTGRGYCRAIMTGAPRDPVSFAIGGKKSRRYYVAWS